MRTPYVRFPLGTLRVRGVAGASGRVLEGDPVDGSRFVPLVWPEPAFLFDGVEGTDLSSTSSVASSEVHWVLAIRRKECV